MLTFLIRLSRYIFGDFAEDEFKKFVFMGSIFALIIGVYWTLRPLKDAIFIQLVDKMHLPYAKTMTVIGLLPLIIIYTKLLEKNSREKMLQILPAFYGSVILIFGLLMFFLQETISTSVMLTILGYAWYLFVESFGSLLVALFWAFATDVTEPASAKRGFPLVVALGQIGGIICPFSVGGLPYRLGYKTDALSLMLLGLLILCIIPLVKYFLKITPKYLLASFTSQNNFTLLQAKPDFLQGLKLIITHKYLLGIVFVNFSYDLIVTIFDFNFKVAAATQYTGVALSHFLSIYGSSVNILSLLFLLLGISNITRYLGVGVALATMPVLIGLALFSFITINSLTFLFMLVVISKAINYALSEPAIKQLYIPTTSAVRFKAQAWIETFGSRASKGAGSMFNMLLKPLQMNMGEIAGRAHYIFICAGLGFPVIILWFITALYLTKTFAQAVKDKKIIC